jgi:hypothetical protein
MLLWQEIGTKPMCLPLFLCYCMFCQKGMYTRRARGKKNDPIFHQFKYTTRFPTRLMLCVYVFFSSSLLSLPSLQGNGMNRKILGCVQPYNYNEHEEPPQFTSRARFARHAYLSSLSFAIFFTSKLVRPRYF